MPLPRHSHGAGYRAESSGPGWAASWRSASKGRPRTPLRNLQPHPVAGCPCELRQVGEGRRPRRPQEYWAQGTVPLPGWRPSEGILQLRPSSEGWRAYDAHPAGTGDGAFPRHRRIEDALPHVSARKGPLSRSVEQCGHGGPCPSRGIPKSEAAQPIREVGRVRVPAVSKSIGRRGLRPSRRAFAPQFFQSSRTATLQGGLSCRMNTHRGLCPSSKVPWEGPRPRPSPRCAYNKLLIGTDAGHPALYSG